MPARFKNPLNFCVGESPLKIEMCLTLLGTKDRQLLYFRFLSMDYLMLSIAFLDDLIVASLTWKTSPDLLAGGMNRMVT